MIKTINSGTRVMASSLKVRRRAPLGFDGMEIAAAAGAEGVDVCCGELPVLEGLFFFKIVESMIKP
jgi:hypothetical protein